MFPYLLIILFSVSGQTLLLPPHVKVKSPNQLGEPLTGSRKRKARKHSITHLLSSKSGTDNRTLEGNIRKEMFYLTTHSTHFIYGYMASDIWLRTILIVREETRCRHIGYYFRLTARVLLYAPSKRQDSTYDGLCYTSRGALGEKRNSLVGSPHEGSIRRPIAP